MSLRFVLGRAGGGKTWRCLKAIAAALREAADGPPLLFLVPEQATFQMERALLEMNGGRAFSRARVLSFRRLAYWAFQEAGGPDAPAIGDLQRRLLLRLILKRRAGGLQVFGRAATQVGFEGEFARLVAEFLRQRLGPEAIREAAGRISVQADPAAEWSGDDGGAAFLVAKMRDIADVFADYQAAVDGRFANPEETPGQLADALARKPSLLAGARVWVDGFASFTAQEELALLAVIRLAETTELCLCMDGEAANMGAARAGLFAETERTRARIEERARALGVAFDPPAILEFPPSGLRGGTGKNRPEPTRFSGSPAIAYLEANLFAPRPVVFDSPPEQICWVEAATPRAQAEAAAREILRLRRERGWRWRDIAVVARSIDDYLNVLAPVFREQGIPLYCDRRRPLDHHPLPAAINAAMRVVTRGWNSADVIEFLKSGWVAGLSAEAIDRLENYVLEHGLTGPSAWLGAADWAAWPRRSLDEDQAWEDEASRERRLALLAQLNTWRRQAISALSDWRTAWFSRAAPRDGDSAVDLSGGGLAEAVADLLRRLDVARALERREADARAEGDLARAEEHRQVLPVVMGVLRELAAALGDEPITRPEAADLVESSLTGLQIGVIPSGLDEIALAAVDRSRQPPLKAALLLGWAEGEFPRVAPQDPLLTDAERERLRAAGCAVAPPTSDLLLNERYLAYIAATRAAEHLWICRPVADSGGEPVPPSPYWRETLRLFPKAIVERAGSGPPEWSQTATPSHWTARWAAEFRECKSTPAARRRLDALRLDAQSQAHAAANERFALRLGLCARAADERNDSRLDASLARAVLAPRGVLTVSLSRIESFHHCAFQHMAAHILGLDARPEFRVEAVDLGALFHAALRLWIEAALEQKADVAAMVPPEIAAAVHAAVDAVVPRLKNELLLSTSRFQYLVGRVKETLAAAAATIAAGFRRGRLAPFAVEVAFGGSAPAASSCSIDLGGGDLLRLRGRIDRVDVVRGGEPAGEIGVVVVDYKTSAREFRPGTLFFGVDLQLPGYLLALAETPGAGDRFGARPVPVGAFYMPIHGEGAAYDHPEDIDAETEDAIHARRRMRGFFDLARLDDVERVEPGRRGVFHRVARLDGGGVRLDWSDAYPAGDVAAILAHTREMIRRAGRDMLAGRADVAPLEYGSESPCLWCPYSSVCRIDPMIDAPRKERPLRREAAMDAIRTAVTSRRAGEA